MAKNQHGHLLSTEWVFERLEDKIYDTQLGLHNIGRMLQKCAGDLGS
jgi:hypothetical protein